MTEIVEFVHGHLFCGIGGGAAGFNRGEARLGCREVRYRCAGGIDVDAGAISAFTAAAGIQGTVLDLFSRDQYIAFHGHEPPSDWCEAVPSDILRAFHGEQLTALFLSAPCKGFSGLLSEKLSKTGKYQALNDLAPRALMLALEAYKNDPIPFILFENVPRIMTRGRWLIDQILQVLHAYDYAAVETTHDCGELGGLSESRNRWLLVSRHMGKVPSHLYEPQKKPLQSVGHLLEQLPLPGDIAAAGPMHRIPELQWKTWVRLAFVEAGSDWRSLQKLRVQDGYLQDFALVPEREYRNGSLGVRRWTESTGTVAGESLPLNGAFSVADPRAPEAMSQYQQYGVRRWSDVSGAISGQSQPGGGAYSVADPRVNYGANSHRNKLRVINWQHHSATVTGASQVQGGALAIADPRLQMSREAGDHYITSGHYGVVPWDQHAGAVTASGKYDNGRHSVADPRSSLPHAKARLQCVIVAMDGTWHRPFTTHELAALQGLVDPGERYALPGVSDSQWREWIGNAVPPPAAAAIASAMGHAMLLAISGETFILNSTPVWVRPIALALAVDQRLPA